MAGSINLRLLLVLMVLLPCFAVQAAKHCRGKENRPKFLQLYAHESLVAPTATVIVSATPSGNKTGDDEFGLIRTISNILRVGSSIDSTQIGSQTGIVVIGKDLVPVYISFTYFLNENATHQGTIAVHGHVDGASTVDRRFAVVGGTGDFLYVTGEDRSAFNAGTDVPDPSNVLNVHNLTLRYLFK